ncbi:hypothetical protein CHUAL_004247 [Chamberlinius hualienensis]
MSGNKKGPEPVQTQVTSSRPTDVSFPSVKDLKEKFALFESSKEQPSNRNDKKYKGYLGNNKLQITGPNSAASTKPQGPKTPTTPTASSKSLSTASNGIHQQNGNASPTTPTTPTKTFAAAQRSSVILRYQAGERKSLEADGVELRKKPDFEGSGSENVKRISSQFNEMRHQTTTYAKTTPEVETRKKVLEEIRANEVEEFRSEVREEIREDIQESLENDVQIESNSWKEVEPDTINVTSNDYEEETRMSTPSETFLQSMSNDSTEELGFNEHKEPEPNDDYETSYTSDDHKEEHHHDTFSNDYDGFETVSSLTEHEHHRNDEDDDNPTYSEITENNYHEDRHDKDLSLLSDDEINVRLDAIDDSEKSVEENIAEHIEEKIEEIIEERIEEIVEERIEEKIEEKIEEQLEN